MSRSKKLRSTGYLNRWNQASQKPGFLMVALILGVTLLFGAPILAQHDKDPAEAVPGVETDAHSAAPGETEHGETGAQAGGHDEGEEHHEEGGAIHPPTLISILADVIEGQSIHTPAAARNPVARFLVTYKAPIYSFMIIVILSVAFITGTRSMTLIPGKYQNFLEWAVESLDGFVCGVLGSEGRRFVPFLGTLFLYIYLQNIFGLFPLMFTPTSIVETTASMAILVFVYVQYVAIRSNGVVGYLRHLAGDPKDVVGWSMAPLMFPLHLVGELAKPLSLSLRLFGNMMGEETLLAVFMGLGITILAFSNLPVGIPLHVPFVFLALLTTFIQALVFTLLSTIYFVLVLPHPEHEEAH